MSSLDLREVFERLPLPAHIESQDRRLVAVNRAWLALFGGECAFYRGRPVDDYLAEGGRDDASGCLRLGDGRVVPARWRSSLLNREGDALVVIVLPSEGEASALLDRQEAMRAGHLASLGEIAAGVAHEINNPINGIINYAQLLHDHLHPREPKQAQVADRIMREGQRISKIVRTLLGFARVPGEALVATDLVREIEAVLSLTRAQIRKENIRLAVQTDGTGERVEVSSNRLQQVILNLIHNARHALNQKYPGRSEDKVLTIRLHPLGVDRHWLRLTVRDEGIGIPPQVLERIPQPFFTTKPAGSGTGLGLSISHDIVSSHGGRLSIESIAGSHTEVHVDLPIAEKRV